MKNYYEPGDRVRIEIVEEFEWLVSIELKKFYQDDLGREKILSDLELNPEGTVKAVKEGTGHLEVLYQPDGHKHSWWIPTSIIKP